ncbi:universal stress protein [Rufibacter glacialis]|uniref:Universal stress protein n=1 Tax=Rufibacter glacialis TaxID=1259555 RepID=A0A5M8Q6Y1_9BACT|nr:universal stress protein [Rufibacter glacialis]KAA6430646.1 universal stress protein [Rufibacter glacialis]GGK85428.1 universal stress protein UspA [Rufibacter glacialis]
MATLLVPTDFSKTATNAVHYAASLAVSTGSRLLVVHTVSVPTSALPESMPLLAIDTHLIEYSEEELQKLALQLKQTYALEVETFCLYGPFIPLVNDLVKTQAVDLVVMGTKGASNVLSKLVGTNTSTFIKEAPCPVLVVPGQATFRTVRHIAYASDFETEETVYLKQLFQVAAGLGAEVHIINVTSETELNIVPDEQVLKSIAKNFPRQNYSVAQLPHEDVVTGLREFVEENQMDLLAVSIQDRDLLESLFHHSITKELALQAFTPLLTLPANPYHYQAPRPTLPKGVPVG